MSDETMNDFTEERKSRTKIKKEMIALQKLGEALVGLSKDQIKKIPMDDELKEALLFAKTLKKHGAVKRQMQYIGVLMRDTDLAPIEKALDRLSFGQRVDTGTFLKAEKWRDALIDGNTETFEEITNLFPDIDRQHINQLIRNAVKERKAEKPPKATQALFDYLYDVAQKNDSLDP